MNDALIASTALAGLVVGAILDPLGQRLADLSRALDEHRKAEQAGRVAEEERVRLGGQVPTAPPPTGHPTPGTPAPSAVPVPELPSASQPVPTLSGSDGDGGSGAMRHLLPAGRSPARTAGAALATAALFASAAAHFGPHPVVAPYCAFFAMLVVVSVTDLSHRLVPRWLVYGGTAAVVALLVVTSAVGHSWGPLSGSAIAGAVAFVVFFGIWWFVPRGLGYGDVRLAGAIGVAVGYLSLLHAYIAFLAGFVIGLIFGLAVLATAETGRRTRIPFAPSLALGAVVGVLWGGHLAQAIFPVTH